MIEFDVILVDRESQERRTVELSFTEADWQRLEGYHRETERLRSSRFVQESRGGSVSVSLSHSSVRSQAEFLDDEAFETLLHRLRPFLLSDEAFYFFSVLKLIGKSTHNVPEFRDEIRTLKKTFGLKNLKDVPSVFRKYGNMPDTPDDVMTWLNAFEYHRDMQKRETATTDLGIYASDQHGRPVVTFVLVEMVKAILGLGDLIETLMIARNGKNEIVCVKPS